MRLDWEIAKRGWRRYAAYPWATAAGVFTNTIFGFLQAYILLAIYRHRTSVGGFDSADAVTYVWLAQAMIMTVYIFSWWELALRIRDGSIATDLLRPLDPQRYWLAYDLGRRHPSHTGIPPFVAGEPPDLYRPSPLAHSRSPSPRTRQWSSASDSASSTTRSPSGCSTFAVS